VPGERIFPFLVSLDLENSILNPAPGQNQRFCYQVTGVGTDNPEFADLSHIIFGICPDITEDQIANITVIIDDEEQDANLHKGKGVILRTPHHPEPRTGCSGLDFNFDLSKAGGEMKIYYELTDPYPVGPNAVCLFGGGTTAQGLTIYGPSYAQTSTCPVVAFQTATVSAPITVMPFANAGTAITYCCEDPVITPVPSTRCETSNGGCRYVLTQKICITVPIEFGAAASVGMPSIRCNDPADEGICAECDPGYEDEESDEAAIYFTNRVIHNSHSKKFKSNMPTSSKFIPRRK
jgi:hypothetical protein